MSISFKYRSEVNAFESNLTQIVDGPTSHSQNPNYRWPKSEFLLYVLDLFELS